MDQGNWSVNIPWDRAAAYYDAHVTTLYDKPFFQPYIQNASGPVLEVMCGTGRLGIEWAAAGVDFTGVDSSAGLLARFQEKLANRHLRADLVQMDARSLALDKSFPLIYIAFHSFSEVLDVEPRRSTFQALVRHLCPRGRLIITLHNPPIRRAAIGPEAYCSGPFRLDESGRSVSVTSRWWLEKDGQRAAGEQVYEEHRPAGLETRITVPMRFDFVERAEMEGHAAGTGVRIVEIFGDYQKAPFDPATSTHLLMVFEKS